VARLLNSDAEAYGGSGVGNLGTVHADDNGRHARAAAARRALARPPLVSALATRSQNSRLENARERG
jgi:hypothetical protein